MTIQELEMFHTSVKDRDGKTNINRGMISVDGSSGNNNGNNTVEESLEDKVRIGVEDTASDSLGHIVKGNLRNGVEYSANIGRGVRNTVKDNVDYGVEDSANDKIGRIVGIIVKDNVGNDMNNVIADSVNVNEKDSIESKYKKRASTIKRETPLVDSMKAIELPVKEHRPSFKDIGETEYNENGVDSTSSIESKENGFNLVNSMAKNEDSFNSPASSYSIRSGSIKEGLSESIVEYPPTTCKLESSMRDEKIQITQGNCSNLSPMASIDQMKSIPTNGRSLMDYNPSDSVDSGTSRRPRVNTSPIVEETIYPIRIHDADSNDFRCRGPDSTISDDSSNSDYYRSNTPPHPLNFNQQPNEIINDNGRPSYSDIEHVNRKSNAKESPIYGGIINDNSSTTVNIGNVVFVDRNKDNRELVNNRSKEMLSESTQISQRNVNRIKIHRPDNSHSTINISNDRTDNNKEVLDKSNDKVVKSDSSTNVKVDIQFNEGNDSIHIEFGKK